MRHMDTERANQDIRDLSEKLISLLLTTDTYDGHTLLVLNDVHNVSGWVNGDAFKNIRPEVQAQFFALNPDAIPATER